MMEHYAFGLLQNVVRICTIFLVVWKNIARKPENDIQKWKIYEKKYQFITDINTKFSQTYTVVKINNELHVS